VLIAASTWVSTPKALAKDVRFVVDKLCQQKQDLLEDYQV